MVGHLKGTKRLLDAWASSSKHIRNPHVGEKMVMNLESHDAICKQKSPWKFEIQEKQRFSQDFRPETLEPLEVVVLGQNFYPKL